MSQLAERTTITQKRFQCRHVHATGRQCGSAALRKEQFCYFHHTTRHTKKTGGFRYLDATEPFELPIVEDRASALSAAAQILCRIASNDLDLGRAGKLLYNLQLLNALLPPEKAAPESTPQPAPSPQPLVEDRVLVEELVLDETHGLIAPITELPEPAVILSDTAAPTNNEARTTDNDPLQNCHPERSSASAPNAVEGPAVASHTATTPRTSPKAPKRVYTDEEKDFLKCTTSSTHYAPVHRPRPESITDDDIIAAINALRRRCSLGPIDTDPNWNKATLSTDLVHPPASRYPEASASGLAPAAQEEGASAPGVSNSRTPTTLPTLQAVACNKHRTTGNQQPVPLPQNAEKPISLRPRIHEPVLSAVEGCRKSCKTIRAPAPEEWGSSMGVVRQSLHPNAKSPAMRRAYLFCLHNFSSKSFVYKMLADITPRQTTANKRLLPNIRMGGGDGGEGMGSQLTTGNWPTVRRRRQRSRSG